MSVWEGKLRTSRYFYVSATEFWDKSYRPPSLPSAMVLVLLVLFSLLMFGRGLEYALEDTTPGVSPPTIVMEALTGIAFWGYLLMGGASALLTGLVLRSHMLVWCSHVFSCALNFAIGIMIAQAAWHFGEGYSELVLPLASMFWHGVFIYLVRPSFSQTAGEAHHESGRP